MVRYNAMAWRPYTQICFRNVEWGGFSKSPTNIRNRKLSKCYPRLVQTNGGQTKTKNTPITNCHRRLQSSMKCYSSATSALPIVGFPSPLQFGYKLWRSIDLTHVLQRSSTKRDKTPKPFVCIVRVGYTVSFAVVVKQAMEQIYKAKNAFQIL